MDPRRKMPAKAPTPHERRDWLSLMARSAPDRLARVLPDLPDHDLLRAPETGTVMVQGRVSATGAPFNIAEMTVTRCSVALSCGTVGHGHVQGRSRSHARRAAVIDALMQTAAAPTLTPHLRAMEAEAQAAAAERAAKAAATRVEFFTLQRGENA